MGANVAKTEFKVIGFKAMLASIADSSPSIFIDSSQSNTLMNAKHLELYTTTTYPDIDFNYLQENLIFNL